MQVTVFYAWQSDRQSNCCHYLIRDAAKDACKRISLDLTNDYSVTLDSDTQGVAGMCNIPDEIRKKIRDADVYLMDLTFVGKADEADKESNELDPMSNPNVLFELGYAAAQPFGFERTVAVMNEHYGKRHGQAFDIATRSSMFYRLAPTANRDETRIIQDDLSRDLEAAFLLICDKVVGPFMHNHVNEKTDDTLLVVYRNLYAFCLAIEDYFQPDRGDEEALVAVGIACGECANSLYANRPLIPDDLFERLDAYFKALVKLQNEFNKAHQGATDDPHYWSNSLAGIYTQKEILISDISAMIRGRIGDKHR